MNEDASTRIRFTPDALPTALSLDTADVIIAECSATLNALENERDAISESHLYAWAISVLRFQVQEVIHGIDRWSLYTQLGGSYLVRAAKFAEYVESRLQQVRHNAPVLARALQTGDYKRMLGELTGSTPSSSPPLGFSLPHQKGEGND